ncbi:MAG: Uxx-star family glutaredoxin-like (seleno)protein [Acidobacteriota bacterium]
MGEKNVKIYTTPTCPFCTAAKDYLKKNNISFTEVDVSRDRNGAMEMIRMTNQTGVPVIVVNSQPIIGFDRKKLDELLNIK